VGSWKRPLSHSIFEEGAAGERKTSMSSRSEEVAGKSDVSCKDTKVTSEAIYETLQGLNSSEASEFGLPSPIERKLRGNCDLSVIQATT